MKAGPRKKIVVLNPFMVYPPTSGGQGRVFYLFKNMARSFDIVILSFSHKRSCKEISPGLFDVNIPKSPLHTKLELDFSREYGCCTCALNQHFAQHTPEFIHLLDLHLKTAAFVILSHPYLVHELEKLSHNAVTIYDAHNVEFDLHQLILPDKAKQLLNDIYEAEKTACHQAALITACSEHDAGRLAGLYNIPPVKCKVIPNGVDLNNVRFITHQERERQKERQNLNKPVAIFMGSDFAPNIEAVQRIITCACSMPTIEFLIFGSVCSRFRQKDLPANAKLRGLVSEPKKSLLLGISDVALNPISAGSGTSLKILEYMAAGVPVVTTLTGARGIDGTDGIHFVTYGDKPMPDSINLLLNNPGLADRIARSAYSLVESKFSWRKIAQDLTLTLEGL